MNAKRSVSYGSGTKSLRATLDALAALLVTVFQPLRPGEVHANPKQLFIRGPTGLDPRTAKGDPSAPSSGASNKITNLNQIIYLSSVAFLLVYPFARDIKTSGHTRSAKTSCLVLVRGSPPEPLDARVSRRHGSGPRPAFKGMEGEKNPQGGWVRTILDDGARRRPPWGGTAALGRGLCWEMVAAGGRAGGCAGSLGSGSFDGEREWLPSSFPPSPRRGVESGGGRSGGARHPPSRCLPRLLSTCWCSTARRASCASSHRTALSFRLTAIWAGARTRSVTDACAVSREALK